MLKNLPSMLEAVTAQRAPLRDEQIGQTERQQRLDLLREPDLRTLPLDCGTRKRVSR